MDFNHTRGFGPSPRFSNGFFNHEAYEAGYFNPYFVGGGLMYGDPNTALQWEIEKQRIRAEMIEEDAERRRQIEEEVRREIAMEREIALSRERQVLESTTSTQDEILLPDSIIPQVRAKGRCALDVHSRPSNGTYRIRNGPGDSEERQNLTPGGTEKSSVVVPTKQSRCTAAGIKRSAPLPHVAGCTAEAAGNELPWLAIPRKKQNTTQSLWICDVCDISCTSSDALADHRLSKKHRRNLSRSKPNLDEGASSKDDSKALQIDMGKLAGGPTSAPAAGKSKSSPKKLGHNKNKAKQQGDTTKFEFWCQLCGVRCNSISVRDKHLNGKKHNRLAWRSVKRGVQNDCGAIQSVEVEVKAMVGGSVAESFALVPKDENKKEKGSENEGNVPPAW